MRRTGQWESADQAAWDSNAGGNSHAYSDSDSDGGGPGQAAPRGGPYGYTPTAEGPLPWSLQHNGEVGQRRNPSVPAKMAATPKSARHLAAEARHAARIAAALESRKADPPPLPPVRTKQPAASAIRSPTVAAR